MMRKIANCSFHQSSRSNNNDDIKNKYISYEGGTNKLQNALKG